MAFPEFAVVAGRESVSEGGLWIPEGERAVVLITFDAWSRIIIPLKGRRLTLAGATIPPPVKARPVQ